MSLLRTLGLASTLACSVVLVPGASRPARAQTLGGQVVQLDSKKPIGGAAVALVNDSARVVASSSAGADGAFYLDAPAAGEYRLVLLVSGGSFVSPSVRLDAGRTVERQFSVPNVPSTFAAALFARDVTKPATPVPGNPAPMYPPGLAEAGMRATISTMFVVDEVGQPDVATFRVLNTSPDERFVASIREALGRTRFVPARKDDEWVPQVVQYTYDFGLPAIPSAGRRRRTPALPAKAWPRAAAPRSPKAPSRPCCRPPTSSRSRRSSR
jgi:hypothetical protein